LRLVPSKPHLNQLQNSLLQNSLLQNSLLWNNLLQKPLTPTVS
jgi:hypothetical protein